MTTIITSASTAIAASTETIVIMSTSATTGKIQATAKELTLLSSRLDSHQNIHNGGNITIAASIETTAIMSTSVTIAKI